MSLLDIRGVFQRTLTDGAGNVLRAGEITVYPDGRGANAYVAGTTSPADIYADDTGGSPIAQPIDVSDLTNPTGFFRFFAPIGEYAIVLEREGSSVTWRNVPVSSAFPPHEWDNTELQFVQFDGTLGDKVNLAPSITVSTTPVNPDTSPSVTATTTPGNPPNVALAFSIPDAATVAVGTVTVVNPDQNPTITDVGQDGDVELEFDIPRASSVTLGTITPVNPDQSPSVSDSGTDGDVVLDFDLPDAPSFEVGEVTVVDAEDPAVITDVGVDGNIKLDFEIPRGPTGSLGDITGLTTADLTDPSDLVTPVQSETSSTTFKTTVQSIVNETVSQLTTQENTFDEKQTIDDDLGVTGNLDVDGEVTINDKVTITDDLDVTGDLGVTGTATFSGEATFSGNNTFTGDNTFSGSTSGPGAMVNGKFVGEVFSIPGNHIAASADFAAVSLTDFLETKTIDEANFPNLVLFLRAQKLIYLEELTGEEASFSGTVSGSVFTLTDNDANNDLVAGLAEWFAANGEYTTIDIGGVTFQITNVNAVTRAITVTGTPTGTSAEIYPHRIAASTTTARLWSWVGKTAIGAGTTETLAMIMRRDQMQQITGSVDTSNHNANLPIFRDNGNGAIGTANEQSDRSAQFQTVTPSRILNRTMTFDSANSPDARTSPTTDSPGATHSPDVATHFYQWAGVVTGL